MSPNVDECLCRVATREGIKAKRTRSFEFCHVCGVFAGRVVRRLLRYRSHDQTASPRTPRQPRRYSDKRKVRTRSRHLYYRSDERTRARKGTYASTHNLACSSSSSPRLKESETFGNRTRRLRTRCRLFFSPQTQSSPVVSKKLARLFRKRNTGGEAEVDGFIRIIIALSFAKGLCWLCRVSCVLKYVRCKNCCPRCFKNKVPMVNGTKRNPTTIRRWMRTDLSADETTRRT